jgi:anti-sigma-K factor RskA
MISERHEELAALRALGLLEDAERSAFDSDLAHSPEVRALADSLVEATAALALTVPQVEPPAALRDRVLAGIGSPAAGQVVAFPLLRFAPWAVAAALALAATWLATQNLFLRNAYATLQTERELAEIASRMAQNQLSERSLLAEKMINDLGNRLRRSEDLSRLKITALASLAGNTKEAQVIAVWDPGQQAGLLSMEKLPAIAETQDYQIWIVDPAYKDPVNGGVFHIAADGNVTLAFKPDQPVAQAAAFAISLEKKGGVPKAEGPIVLLGK